VVHREASSEGKREDVGIVPIGFTRRTLYVVRYSV
jgi:hypothetical protein